MQGFLLSGGTVGYEAEFFGGRPSWQKLRAIPPITLTDKEKAFLDGATEPQTIVLRDTRTGAEMTLGDVAGKANPMDYTWVTNATVCEGTGGGERRTSNGPAYAGPNRT